MKRLLTVLLACLLLVGCTPEKQMDTRYVAVLKNEKGGLLVFLDADTTVVGSVSCDLPEKSYFDSDKVGVLNSKGLWTFFDLINGKQIGQAKIDNELLYYGRDGGYVRWLDSEMVLMDAKGQSEQVHTGLVAYYNDQHYLYYVDGYNYLHIVDLTTYREVGSYGLNEKEFEGFTTIGQTSYLTSVKGFTEIALKGLGMTYLYSEPFGYYGNAIGDHLYVYDGDQGEEMVVYKIAIESYRMTMTLEMDERYYRGVEFEKVLKTYLDEGYTISNFFEKGLEYAH